MSAEFKYGMQKIVIRSLSGLSRGDPPVGFNGLKDRGSRNPALDSAMMLKDPFRRS